MNFDQAVARIRAMCGQTRTNFITHEEVYHSGIYDDGSSGHCDNRYTASIFGSNGTPSANECELITAKSPEELVYLVRAYLAKPPAASPESRIAADLGIPVEKLVEIATEDARKVASMEAEQEMRAFCREPQHEPLRDRRTEGEEDERFDTSNEIPH